MMGVSDAAYWLSYLLKNLFFVMWVSMVSLAILTLGNVSVFEKSDFTIVFSFFMLYATSVMFLSFLMTTIFHSCTAYLHIIFVFSTIAFTVISLL